MMQDNFDRDPLDAPVPYARSVAGAHVSERNFHLLRFHARRWRHIAHCWMWTSAVILLFALLTCISGCTTTPPSGVESAWLAVHAMDTAQTITIARNPGCLYEGNKLAAALYGSKHPSPGKVLAINTAMGLLHWQVGAYLDRHGSEAARITFYSLSFLGSGGAVANNALRGIRPLAGGDQCGGTR